MPCGAKSQAFNSTIVSKLESLLKEYPLVEEKVENTVEKKVEEKLEKAEENVENPKSNANEFKINSRPQVTSISRDRKYATLASSSGGQSKSLLNLFANSKSAEEPSSDDKTPLLTQYVNDPLPIIGTPLFLYFLFFS